MDFKKFARKFGFTPTELKVILILGFALLAGLVLRYFDYDKNHPPTKFDYSRQDSLFTAYDSVKKVKEGIFEEKKVDSKQELLDFSKNKSKIKNTLSRKSKFVNINSASAAELSDLPGIGMKTAERIIEKREELKSFKHKEDLLLVKGIGNKKFAEIKKFIIVK